jgi:hypothetical protein
MLCRGMNCLQDIHRLRTLALKAGIWMFLPIEAICFLPTAGTWEVMIVWDEMELSTTEIMGIQNLQRKQIQNNHAMRP